MVVLKSRRRLPTQLAGCIAILLIVAMGLALAGCGSKQTATKGPDPNKDPKAAYLKACEDAKTVTPAKVETDLKAVIAGEPGVTWQGTPGSSRVKVVTWTKKDYYDKYAGQDYKLPADANVWVSLYPEVKNFANKDRVSNEPLRIEQLLGLPPGNNATKFVEFWVNPADMFRPSPDPEITDHEANVDFPTINNRFLSFNDSSYVVEWDGAANADKSYTYQQWFDNRKSTVYSGAYPYPWTRLGYTYDWGTNAKNHEGPSEFVILGGSTINVSSVTPTAEYLKSD